MLPVMAVLAAADLATKAAWETPPELLHERSTTWVGASSVLLLGCLASMRVASPLVCGAAAVCAAGLLGNLVSAVAEDGKVPDPLLLGGAAHGIAFNPADVFVLLGLFGLATAAIHRRLAR
jgi:lipoprotein signal peptidase